MSAPLINAEAVSNPSLWDRVSTWVAENKAVAYTIAGTVVVITAAGTVYYLSDSRRTAASTEKRKSKKERRKEKQEAREAEQSKEQIKLQDEEAGKSTIFSSDLEPLLIDTLAVQPAQSTATEITPPPVKVETQDDLPDVTEANVDTFSQEVY